MPEKNSSQSPVKINKFSLAKAITATAQECDDKVERRPVAIENSLFAGGRITIHGFDVDLSGASAVLNAVALLRRQYQPPVLLMEKLIEKYSSHGDIRAVGQLIEAKKGNEFFVTPIGFTYLLSYAVNPDSRPSLDLITAPTDNLGQIHKGLINNQKAVVIDAITDHAFTVGGVIQKGNEVSWIAIAPDKITEEMLKVVGAKPYAIGNGQEVKSFQVDPRNLADRISSPIWMVSRSSLAEN